MDSKFSSTGPLKPVVALTIVALLGLSGCYKTKTIKESYWETVQEPYQVVESTPQELVKKIPIHHVLPGVFPASVRTIAVAGFTSSTGDPQHGNELAYEIEYALMKDTRTAARFTLIDRAMLASKLSGKELKGLGQLQHAALSKAYKELGVQGLIIGHVKNHGPELSFIVKAVEAKSSTVIWMEKFSGPYDTALGGFIDRLFPRKQVVDYKVIKSTVLSKKSITKYRPKKIKKFRMVTKKIEDKQHSLKVGGLIALGVVVVVGGAVIAYQVSQ